MVEYDNYVFEIENDNGFTVSDITDTTGYTQTEYAQTHATDHTTTTTSTYAYVYDCYSCDVFRDIIIFLGVIQMALVLSFSIVSIFVYKPMREKCEREEILVDFPEAPYEDKYSLQDTPHVQDEVNKHNFVCETTPDGVVFMTYDTDEEGFIYWSNRSISFTYLDVVARKFVKSFLCKKLYLNGNDADDDADADDADANVADAVDADADDVADAVDDADADDVADAVDSDADVFASFSKHTSNNKKNVCEKTDGNTIVRNKFIHKGKIADYIQQHTYDFKEVSEKKKLSFDAFKRMFYR